MASLQGNTIASTYESLLKTCNNCSLPSTGLVPITDGGGEESSLYLGKANQGACVIGDLQATCDLTVGGNFTANILQATCCIDTGGDLFAATAGAAKKVGIGNTGISPQEKLTVNGSISASEDLYVENLKDCNNNSGSANQFLQAKGTNDGFEWVTLAGAGCTGNISGTGTANCLAKFDSSNSLTDSVVSETVAGNIGINQSNPTEKLHVNGNVKGTSFKGNLCGNICGARCTSDNLTVGGSLISTNQITANNGICACAGTSEFKGTLNFCTDANICNGIVDCDGSAGTSEAVLTSTGSKVVWKTLASLPATSATTANSLASSRNFSICGGATATAVAFNGTQNVLLNVTDINACCLTSGTVPAARLPDINACELGGKPLATECKQRSRVSWIASDGVMEIGKYIDFHDSDSSGDYDARIEVNSSGTLHFNPNNNISCFIGSIKASGDIIAYCTSDKNLKKDLTCVKNSNSIITNLNAYCFKYNEKSSRENDEGIGFIAQEVKEVLPRVVCSRKDGTLAVDYLQFIPILTEEVKRLNKRVEELENKLSS